MNSLVLTPEAIHQGSLILVNRDHPLRGRHDQSLVRIGEADGAVLLDSRAAAMLGRLLQAVDGAGQIQFVSGYRSQAEQEQLYTDSLSQNGADFTAKYVALPGCSEHQTGLAIDLARLASKPDLICPDFPDEGVCGLFLKRAAGHGFVLRYSAEKEPLTGIAHEPWHFRYVGYPHSEIMHAHGFCLEEYTDFLRNSEKPVQFVSGGYRIEIRCIPASQCGHAPAIPPDAVSFQLSGNNVDGFVLTVWRRG